MDKLLRELARNKLDYNVSKLTQVSIKLGKIIIHFWFDEDGNVIDGRMETE